MRGSHNLRLVLLWFATWKNGQSSYPPDWVKKDFERFPRAQIVGGTWPVFGGEAGQPRVCFPGRQTFSCRLRHGVVMPAPPLAGR